jgi:hypothetical protein
MALILGIPNHLGFCEILTSEAQIMTEDRLIVSCYF